jgi:hypothetical protein
MKIQQTVFRAGELPLFESPLAEAQLLLAFGDTSRLDGGEVFAALRQAYPRAAIVGCSGAGEIHGNSVSDQSLVVSALHFEQTAVRLATATVGEMAESFSAGQAMAAALLGDGLCHVLVFSDGLCVNGSELVRGFRSELPPGVELTGGLAGDGERFQRTLVFADAPASERTLVAVGFYGSRLAVGYGSVGGWDTFGPERLITRSAGNVLFDLDGQPALELYKRYLGEHAAGLPATGLLFPLLLRSENGGVVRTILGVNEAEQSMTFAGDMPEGLHARLMKANFDRLVDGAVAAAEVSLQGQGDRAAQFALLISCVGRKLVLKQRIDEEVLGIRQILGNQLPFAGFYSYGEISPHHSGTPCQLHNQTMSITTFGEY